MEPLQKDLGFGIAARLDAKGMLTLTEVQSVPVPESLVMAAEEEEIVITEIVLPPDATRALLNFLRTQAVRTYHGGRK